MSLQFSPVVAAHRRALPGFTSLLYVDLQELGVAASPVAVLDDFRVTGMPFSPHPHAGFAAVTYVLEDSPGGLRSRASSGADLLVGPGGIVWTQAGSGIVHEEVPAVPGRELHGLQIFVNLSSRNKLAAPQVLSLAPDEVPEWRSGAGDRVRVVVGTFEDVTSPLIPAEPFTLLDVTLSQDISVDLQAGYNAVAYLLSGQAQMSSEHDQVQVDASHAAAALHSTGDQVRFTARRPAQFVLLTGPEICEPIVSEGPFIMSEQSQIHDAIERYRRGAMGHLAPLTRDATPGGPLKTERGKPPRRPLPQRVYLRCPGAEA